MSKDKRAKKLSFCLEEKKYFIELCSHVININKHDDCRPINKRLHFCIVRKKAQIKTHYHILISNFS